MQNILLITPAANADLVADAIRREFEFSVQLAPTCKAALVALRQAEFTLVLLDEPQTVLDPRGVDHVYQYAGVALLLELNFAVSGAPRVLRQIRAALARRSHDEAGARAAVTASLQSELNASLTGLLLESQLALREASPEQAPKLQHVVELATDMRSRLRSWTSP